MVYWGYELASLGVLLMANRTVQISGWVEPEVPKKLKEISERRHGVGTSALMREAIALLLEADLASKSKRLSTQRSFVAKPRSPKTHKLAQARAKAVAG
jgi:hypothetical protein